MILLEKFSLKTHSDVVQLNFEISVTKNNSQKHLKLKL